MGWRWATFVTVGCPGCGDDLNKRKPRGREIIGAVPLFSVSVAADAGVSESLEWIPGVSWDEEEAKTRDGQLTGLTDATPDRYASTESNGIWKCKKKTLNFWKIHFHFHVLDLSLLQILIYLKLLIMTNLWKNVKSTLISIKFNFNLEKSCKIWKINDRHFMKICKENYYSFNL